MPEENMRPITNPALVDAMTAFRADLKSRDNEKAFLQAAVEARYLLPAQIQPIEQQQEGEPQQHSIAFQIMSTPDGQKFMPAFTDEDELKKNRKPGETFQVAVMSFEQIYHFIKSNQPITGVVINPFGGALCLNRAQIVAIGDAKGDITVGLQPQQPVNPVRINNAQPVPMQQPSNILGAAENSREQQQAAIREAMKVLDSDETETLDAAAAEKYLTDDLLNAIKGCLKKQKAVKKAYIQPAAEHGERYLLIALEADDNTDIEAIQSAVSADCADYSDLPFDCVAATSIRAKELVAAEKPFYEKKRFGIF